ncbi:hypothetical protein FRC01_001923 [Tulasnella sp. 417]|nr:hypothetical protein FRC01_001923 [Tulasnella sp. 417]
MENESVLHEQGNAGTAQPAHHTEGPLLENNSQPPKSGPHKYKFLEMDSNDLVTIQVDQVLFRVSADILRLCSAVNKPIANSFIMSGITAPRLSSFLTVATAKTIKGQFSLPLNEWVLALHAAMQLGCDEVREYAVKSIDAQVKPKEAVSLIRLGLRYHVYEWARDGFALLIERGTPLSLEEGNRLGMELVLAIVRCREALTRRREGDNFTTSELINTDPYLKSPNFVEIDEIEFHEYTDTSSVSPDQTHYRSDLVNLQVDDTVWTVSMSALGFTSYFVNRIAESECSGPGGWLTIDLSSEVERADLESYLSLINARRFRHSSGETLRLSFREWVGALRLSTIFGHNDARRFAISFLERQLLDHDPFDVIDAAKTCDVERWLKSQYARIAKRDKFPSEEEARRLGFTSLLAQDTGGTSSLRNMRKRI